MRDSAHKRWIVVAAIGIVVCIAFGATFYTEGVFVLPLAHFFHYSRGRVSLLFTIAALTAAMASYFVGWLLDRFRIKPIMTCGVILTGIALLVLSRAGSFLGLAIGYGLVGFGLNASTMIPATFVVTRSFDKARGTILGVIMAGESVGGMFLIMLSSHVMAHYGTADGWRMAYVALAVPVFVIALPAVLFFIEDLPPIAVHHGEGESSGPAAGLEVGEALRTRSFWLLAFAMFGTAFALSGENAHVIPGLLGASYSAAAAASIWGLALGVKSVGQLGFGAVADWITARTTFALTSVASGAAILLMIASGFSHLSVILFIAFGASTIGVSVVLIPIVQAESLGLKRFASILALFYVAATSGVMVGPLSIGWLFDITHSYWVGYSLIAALVALSGIASLFCVPLESVRPIPAPITQEVPIPAPSKAGM